MRTLNDPFARLHTELADMSAGLGFVVADSPELVGEEELLARAWTWRSPFATLLVVPVDSLEATLSRATAAGEAWLRDHIDAEEMQGRLVDGYLLIAAARPPSGPVASAVDEVEQSPFTCRKHVLWPEGDSWRARLLRVTTLSLPDPPPPMKMGAEAELPPAAERVLELYRRSGSTDLVVENVRAYAARVAAGRTGAG